MNKYMNNKKKVIIIIIRKKPFSDNNFKPFKEKRMKNE